MPRDSPKGPVTLADPASDGHAGRESLPGAPAADDPKRLRTRSDAIERVSDAFVALDRAWHFTYVNVKAGQMLDRRPDDLIGKPIRTELPEAVGRNLLVACERAMAEQMPVVFEDPQSPGDRWLEYRIHPSPDGLTICFHDITERKRGEERAVWLASFPERNPNPILELDVTAGIIHYVNPAARRRFPEWLDDRLRHPLVAGLPEMAASLPEPGTMQRELSVGGSVFLQTIIPIPDARRIRVYCSEITERTGAETALQQSEQRLRGRLDTMFVFVGLMNLDGEIMAVNHAPLEAAGLKREDVLGRAVAESYWFSHSPALQAQVREALTRAAQGEIMRNDYSIRVAGGRKIIIDTTFAPLRDASGQVTQIVGSAVDITDRTQTESRLHRLVNSNAQGVIFWNKLGEITQANDAFLRIVGYGREDLEAGRVNWAAMTPPEYAHLDRHALEEMSATGVCTPFEKEYIRKDGSRVPILLGAANFEDNSEEGVCFVLDITARKRTEQALHESEERFRFLNALTEATRTLADPAQIMAVSARMLGGHLRASRCAFADVEPDGEQFTLLHDYTDGCASAAGHYQLSRFGPRAVATLHRGQTLVIRNVETELLPGEGADLFNVIGIKATITCPLMKEGGLRALMAVHQAAPRDWKPGEITLVREVVERCWATIERRTAEEKIRQLNAELEWRVVERTAQLEVANKELEAFSYSVSHDLRAPLRAVDGFSQAVLEDCGPLLPEQGRSQLQVIRKCAQQMGDLIDDLLTFSRLSRQPLSKQQVETSQLVRATLAEMKAGDGGPHLQISIGELPACEADPSLLKQVWVNLLSNALKYSRNRKPAVLEIGCVEQQGRHVYFVRDNGTGFDMRYASKLFGVFQRLHRAEDFEGTGVGLAIVERIVQRHGGRIWAEAAVDQGATFYFTLEKETHS